MKLEDLPNTAMIVIVAAVVFISGFLVLTNLNDGYACPASFTWNESSLNCYETANHSNKITGVSYAGNASIAMSDGMSNITSYADTWGTIIGVAVLLAVVIGGFMFGTRKGWF